MKINIKNEKAYVYTPYNKNFVLSIKNSIGGAKWNGECWIIPVESIDTCRKIMMDCYGESDVSEIAEMFSVKFKIDTYADRESLEVFGKSLAVAYGRDSGARLGNDFELIDGKIGSGGSSRNWTSWAKGVFVAHKITQTMIDLEKEKNRIEIIEISKKSNVNIDELVKEKERLLNRIKEIDKILEMNKYTGGQMSV